MPLSSHEQSVRDAVAKTERQNKLRAAQWGVEKAQKEVDEAAAVLGHAKERLASAKLALDAVTDQIKIAEKDAKKAVAPAAPEKVVTPTLPPPDITKDGDPLAKEPTA